MWYFESEIFVRWSRSSLLVFAAALLASLSIHLPVYEVLGVLARALERDKPSSTPPSQIEFEVAQLEASQQPHEDKQAENADKSDASRKDKAKPEKRQKNLDKAMTKLLKDFRKPPKT